MFDSIANSLNIIKKYVDENGAVYLTGGNNFYAVSIEKYDTPWLSTVRQRGRLNALAAEEFFDVATRFVRGEIEWAEPTRKFSCKYNPNRSRGCTCANCPKKLGGAAYWELFSKSCLFRHGRNR